MQLQKFPAILCAPCAYAVEAWHITHCHRNSLRDANLTRSAPLPGGSCRRRWGRRTATRRRGGWGRATLPQHAAAPAQQSTPHPPGPPPGPALQRRTHVSWQLSILIHLQWHIVSIGFKHPTWHCQGEIPAMQLRGCSASTAAAHELIRSAWPNIERVAQSISINCK